VGLGLAGSWRLGVLFAASPFALLSRLPVTVRFRIGPPLPPSATREHVEQAIAALHRRD